MQDDEEEIRRKAYSIWEREGRPEGRHDSHWEQARREAAGQGVTGGGRRRKDAEARTPSAPDGGAGMAEGAPRRLEPGQVPGPNAGSRATRRGRA